MEYDCTLIYPELSGFPNCSCRPHPTFSLSQRRRIARRQVASALIGIALLEDKYHSSSDEQVLAECDAAVAACRCYGSELVVLFHPGLPDDSWYEFFERMRSRMLRDVAR